jgi:hypothetical protein
MPQQSKTIPHEVGDRIKLASNHSKVGTVERCCLLGVPNSISVIWDDEPDGHYALFGEEKINNTIIIDPEV